MSRAMMDPVEATDFSNRVMPFMMRAMQLKQRMSKENKFFCKTTCTINGCEGEMHVRLDRGKKRHARVWCSVCELSMME